MLVAALLLLALPAEVRPDLTLKMDAFDAPFAIAVEEAAKASSPRVPEPAAAHVHAPPPAPATEPARAESTAPRRAPAAKPAVVYTCPMHPEIRSAKPGKCPKCGMTLVPKK